MLGIKNGENMKKIIGAFLLALLSVCLTSCGTNSVDNYSDTNTEVIASIVSKKEDCIPKLLILYENNTYKLYTSYKACYPEYPCDDKLTYSQFIEGEYNYDVLKIIESSTNADKITYTSDNLPEYIITLGESYVAKYDTLTFIVERNKENLYLNNFLKSINVDLKKCAYKDY